MGHRRGRAGRSRRDREDVPVLRDAPSAVACDRRRPVGGHGRSRAAHRSAGRFRRQRRVPRRRRRGPAGRERERRLRVHRGRLPPLPRPTCGDARAAACAPPRRANRGLLAGRRREPARHVDVSCVLPREADGLADPRRRAAFGVRRRRRDGLAGGQDGLAADVHRPQALSRPPRPAAPDVLVAGAGVAGLQAALAAARAGARVLVVAAGAPSGAHSTKALGGMNGVLGDEADWREHARDTIVAGDYLDDQDAVEAMCTDASDTIAQLLADGVPMRHELLGRTGHWPYLLPDMTGRSIVAALAAELERAPNVELRTGVRALELLVDDGVCRGARVTERGRAVDVGARATVLATGGFGALFRRTVASPEATGAGAWLAYRAGAALLDMEFVQYHPTVLAGSGQLVSERVRGAGARLYNANGERFMEHYAPAALELAPRDVASRAIAAEVAAGRGVDGGAALDCAAVPAERWTLLAPIVDEIRAGAGVDPRGRTLVVAPAVHYTMGGVATDSDGRTSVPGLFAAGEDRKSVV